jgi:hypothetical protein
MVEGTRPKAAAPPLVLWTASVSGTQLAFFFVKLVVFQRPPPDVST